MSGHVVMIPGSAIDPVTLGVELPALGAGLATITLAASVKRLVDAQLCVAREHLREEKERFHAWFQFLQQQQREMSRMEKAEQFVRTVELQLSSIELTDVVVSQKTLEIGEGPERKEYLSLGKQPALSREKVRAILADLLSLIEAFPLELRKMAHSPYAVLVGQVQRLSAQFDKGSKIQQAELLSLKSTVSATLAAYLKTIDAERQEAEEVKMRLEKAVDDVLFYESIAVQMPAHRAVLIEVHEQLQVLLGTPDVTPAQIGVLERRLATVKKQVDLETLQNAQRTGLCESITRNLSVMGYEAIEAFPDDKRGMAEALMRVPGGERVRIVLHPNNRLGFEFLHERTTTADGTLSLEELTHMRKQETRWCGDMKELLRKMVAEGFDYGINFEEVIPEQAIKVVVVETGADLTEENEHRMDDEQQKRYL